MASTTAGPGVDHGLSAPQPADPRRRSIAARTREIATRMAWFLLGVTAALVVWEVGRVSDVLPRQYFPSVTEIGAALFGYLDAGEFWADMGRTAADAGWGLLIGTGGGLVLGVVIGVFKPLFYLTRFVIDFCRSIPAVALIPLVVVVYGITRESATVLVAFATLFPMTVQSMYGVRSAEPVAIATARSYRLGPLRTFRSILVPAALPAIATGLRISGSIALLVSVTSELVIGVPGMGNTIGLVGGGTDYARLYALIAAVGVLGATFNTALSMAERKTMPWAGRSREHH
jgi:ABC-type nitrate/sulfonate/bicarbonate transport system permease component